MCHWIDIIYDEHPKEGSLVIAKAYHRERTKRALSVLDNRYSKEDAIQLYCENILCIYRKITDCDVGDLCTIKPKNWDRVGEYFWKPFSSDYGVDNLIDEYNIVSFIEVPWHGMDNNKEYLIFHLDDNKEWLITDFDYIENANSKEIINVINSYFLEIECYDLIVRYIYLSSKNRKFLCDMINLTDNNKDIDTKNGKIWTAEIITNELCNNKVIFSTKKINNKEIKKYIKL